MKVSNDVTDYLPKGLIFRQLSLIVAKMPAVGKNQQNTLQKYKYRGIEDVIAAAKPLLAEFKVFVVPIVVRQEQKEHTNDRGTLLYHTHLMVEHHFYAEDGSSVVATTVGEAIDSSDKSCNKAMTAAFKYALNEVLFISSEDMVDTETEHNEASTPLHPQKTAAPRFSPEHPENYVATFGKNKGMSLKQIGLLGVQDTLNWVLSQPTPGKALLEFKANAEKFLNQPHQDQQDDIPF